MTDNTRALLEQALETLDNIPHPPWRNPSLTDAIRSELAKPEQEESFIPNWANYRQGVADGKAGNPKWHDAPTCAGLWLCFENGYAYAYPEEWDKGFAYGEDSRWYGPISPDTGNKS